ncbi:MAG TPA: FtsQ-type POTRA domain-containing protein [Terriglobales bacterium]|nr:FtsQ-type POTRA domain-containing protein [Terriglobales bacterium]
MGATQLRTPNAPFLSPRARVRALGDFGERSAFVADQQIGTTARRWRFGRARRPAARVRPARGRGLARLVRRVAVALLLAAMPAAMAAAGWWLVSSPKFAVRSVDVRGIQQVAPERIREAAGVAPGQSLFLLDPRRIVRAVEALPGVERADVIRELPNRVTVVVEERKPFTLVHAGRLHWIDENGRVLGRETQAVTPPAPVISGLSEAELASLGAEPSGKARDAIRLIRALLRSNSPLATEISEIDMGHAEGPVLYTVSGVEVRLGAEEWEERLARLEGVLAQKAAREGAIRAVDLRFRDQVVLQGGR